LIYQPYYDPESNRQYLGNPLLVDSQLYNAEARAEWYFDTDQRVSLAGFYKKIENPIEAFVTQQSGDFITSFANAPEAQLYGAELEVQKSFDLGWDSRRIVLIGNYTYTKSELKVGADDVVRVYGASSGIATDYFRDGIPLTGQSDPLVNLQFGLDADDRLSQQTVMVPYASDRGTSRGRHGTPRQPGLIESPGLRVDWVVGEALNFRGQRVEGRREVRNIFGRKHEESQRFGENRSDANADDVGTRGAVARSMSF